MEVKELSQTDFAKDPVIAQMMVNNHEQIVFCNDNATGLRAIVAIHKSGMDHAATDRKAHGGKCKISLICTSIAIHSCTHGR